MNRRGIFRPRKQVRERKTKKTQNGAHRSSERRPSKGWSNFLAAQDRCWGSDEAVVQAEEQDFHSHSLRWKAEACRTRKYYPIAWWIAETPVTKEKNLPAMMNLLIW